MWTRYGFFEVKVEPKVEGHIPVTLYANRFQHFEALADACSLTFKKVVRLVDNEYRFSATVTLDEWRCIMAHIADSLL